MVNILMSDTMQVMTGKLFVTIGEIVHVLLKSMKKILRIYTNFTVNEFRFTN